MIPQHLDGTPSRRPGFQGRFARRSRSSRGISPLCTGEEAPLRVGRCAPMSEAPGAGCPRAVAALDVLRFQAGQGRRREHYSSRCGGVVAEADAKKTWRRRSAVTSAGTTRDARRGAENGEQRARPRILRSEGDEFGSSDRDRRRDPGPGRSGPRAVRQQLDGTGRVDAGPGRRLPGRDRRNGIRVYLIVWASACGRSEAGTRRACMALRATWALAELVPPKLGELALRCPVVGDEVLRGQDVGSCARWPSAVAPHGSSGFSRWNRGWACPRVAGSAHRRQVFDRR